MDMQNCLTSDKTQLFTDFVFADFLVTYTPYFSQVVFQYVIVGFSLSALVTSDYIHKPQTIPLVRF